MIVTDIFRQLFFVAKGQFAIVDSDKCIWLTILPRDNVIYNVHHYQYVLYPFLNDVRNLGVNES